MLNDVTISLDLNQLLGGDIDTRRTRVYVKTNVTNNTLIDTSTGETRLGDERVTLEADGTGSFTTWGVGADGNPTSWQTSVVVEYPRAGSRDRVTRTFGPYTITDADDGKTLAELEDEQAIPAEYQTAFTEQAQSYLDAQVAVAGIDDTDSAVAALLDDALVGPLTQAAGDTYVAGLIDDPASATTSSLTASFERTTMVSRALGDGTDQTATLNAEIAAATTAGKALALPAGTVTVASGLTIPDGAVLVGSGYGTTLNFTGSGTLLALASRLRVAVRDVRLHATHASATLLELSNSFRCVFDRVTFDGEHTSATGSTYRSQTGIKLLSNAGDNRFTDCDINNLGIGIFTDTIQNYFTGCNIGTCWKSIQGGDATGTNYRAGISFKNGTLVGTIGATDTHVDILGASADWWFAGVHMEKCDKALVVGSASGGGPRSFSLSDAFVASETTTLNLVGCRQPWLSNVTFSAESGGTPTDLVIDATNAAAGFASNLRPRAAFDFADSVFPAGWTVLGNRSGAGKVPRLLQAENWQALIPASAPTSGNANFGASAAFDATYYMNMYRVSTGAQNAEISWKVDLSAGTWSLQLAHKTETNRGIYTVQVDGVTVGTIDGYAPTGSNPTISTIAGITIATGGVHTVRLLMATKNASASSYYGTPSFLSFTRTA